MSTAILIERLVKRYAPSPAPPAVDGVSLSVQPGELFFLLGPSGCGKTTLLRMIAGFIDPTGGSIAFADATGARRDVTHLPPNKRNTGMVFQSYALWPHMSVFDNVAFGLSVRKVDKAETQRRVMEALATVQMEPFAQRRPNALSGGQQQRVALAARSSSGPTCSCSTSRSATSTPSCASSCARRSARSASRRASPASTSRMIRKKP
ncbi:MAG: ABC transporter ATP-binding protein [Phycisphaerales bacterium]